MKRGIYILTAGLLAISMSLFAIWQSADLPNKQNNGFVRTWLSKPISERHTQRFVSTPEKISGLSDKTIYFSTSDPRWLFTTDQSLRIRDTLYVGLTAMPELQSPNTTVDSPYLYMYPNSMPYIIRGNVHDVKVDTVHLTNKFFTRFAQLNPRILWVRGIDSSGMGQSFKKIDCIDRKVMREAVIVEDRSDGGFAADGFLRYDASTNRLVYLQMYQNRFFTLDTNLNVLGIGHTIDTNVTNQVVIQLIKEKGELKLTPAGSRQTINAECTVADGKLYVVPGLRADNESISEFNTETPIDVYTIREGKYQGSIRLRKTHNEKILEIRIRQKLLIALYKNGYASTYKLP